MTISHQLSKVFFVALTATTLNLHQLDAMEKPPVNIKKMCKDFAEFNALVEPIYGVISQALQTKNPETICLLIIILSEASGSALVTSVLKICLEKTGTALSEIIDDGGRTPLQHACIRYGRLQAAAPILLAALDIEQQFKLLVVKDNASGNVLLNASSGGLTELLSLFMQIAAQYAQDCPERKKEVFEWLHAKSIFGQNALELLTCGLNFLDKSQDTPAYIICLKILKEADAKYRPDRSGQ